MRENYLQTVYTFGMAYGRMASDYEKLQREVFHLKKKAGILSRLLDGIDGTLPPDKNQEWVRDLLDLAKESRDEIEEIGT